MCITKKCVIRVRGHTDQWSYRVRDHAEPVAFHSAEDQLNEINRTSFFLFFE